ncbi:MAG TPA: hypothetical protein VL326_05385 [Kofleriaceae bacterium]|nr:hypothetical protein [Kofleriaceae bacterium]
MAVLVANDAVSHLTEKATYCAPNDPKRPSLVGLPDATQSQICPDDGSAVTMVDDAYPDGWYVRIMFDELLNPDIETLTPVLDDDDMPTGTSVGSIAGTHPVDLQCKSTVDGQFHNVDYDGYYSPAGNNVTWPLGPSLVVKPNDPKSIATNTECKLTLGTQIVDKSGETVPTAQLGPYNFKVAPIKVIALDPPTDDPEYKTPIDANVIYFDNPYVQFNTTVDISSLCPDVDDDGLCDDESTFSIKDVAHPDEGPGYCGSTADANDSSFSTCGATADCTAPDDVCGRGFCGISGNPCNKASECPDPDDTCGTNYAYSYLPVGLTDTEFGLGPPEPVETEHKYIFSFTAGAKLKDRCGAVTTLPTPTADNLMLAHFITKKFDVLKPNIVTGETASAMKRLQYNWNNVLEGSDFTPASGSVSRVLAGGAYISPAIATSGTTVGFTIAPLPKKLTAACQAAGAGCATADLDPDELMLVSTDASGQMMMQGHLQMNTEYTATLKAGTIIKDFYGKMYTNTSDQVIKWKTAANIAVTSIGVRYTGQLFSIADKGTVTLPTPTTTVDVRVGFNASMDPTTITAAMFTVEAVGTETPTPPTLAVASASGCGQFVATAGAELTGGDNRTGWIGACTLRVRGLYKPGTYKVTFKKDSALKDIFGTAYTQAADQSITFTVENAPPAVQCF